MSFLRRRQLAGVPAGGQFAATIRDEADVTLTPPVTAAKIDLALEAADTVLHAALAAQDEANANVRTSDRDLRAAVGALDSWIAEQPRRRRPGTAPAEILIELERCQTSSGAAKEQWDAANWKVDEVSDQIAHLRDSYPWVRTGQPTVQLGSNRERPVTCAPSGRLAFHDFPAGHPQHGDVGVAVLAGGRWVPTGTIAAADAAALHTFASQEALQ